MNNMDLRVKDVLTEDFWIMPATPKYTESGVPYITSKNIKNGIIDFTKINYISKESYDSISKNRPILVGDILISMIGTLGETAEVKESNGLFYGQNMFLVRIDEKKVDKRYFLNFFKSNYVKRMLEGKQNQSTQKYLKANHIEDLIIPVPSLDKQKLISSQLDKLSNIISLRSKELEYLDELVKARFIELFGDIKLNEKQFPIKKLNEISQYWNGLTYKPENVVKNEKDGTLVLRSSNIQNCSLCFDDNVYVNCMIKEKQYVKENDILMCSRNGSARLVGKTALIKGLNKPTSFGAFMMIIRSDYYPYLKIFFEMDSFKKQISTGTSTINQITVKMLNQVELPVPSMNFVYEFNQFCKQVDKSRYVSGFYKYIKHK